MAALLVLALSLQALAHTHDGVRLLDQALAPPVTGADPVGQKADSLTVAFHEELASGGLGLSMLLAAVVADVFLPQSGDIRGRRLPYLLLMSALLTPFLSATAVWGIEGRARPGRAWWPILLTSLLIRAVGGLLTFTAFVVYGPLPEARAVGGLAISLIGGTAGEVLVARWGAGAQAAAPERVATMPLVRLAF